MKPTALVPTLAAARMALGLLAALSTAPLVADDSEHEARKQIYNEQKSILDTSTDTDARLRALSVMVAIATGPKTVDVVNLTEDALLTLGTLTDDPRLDLAAMEGIRQILLNSQVPGSPTSEAAYVEAVRKLKVVPSTAAGRLLRQRKVVQVLTSALDAFVVSQNAQLPLYNELLVTLTEIAKDPAFDQSTRLRATLSLIRKGTSYFDLVVAAKNDLAARELALATAKATVKAIPATPANMAPTTVLVNAIMDADRKQNERDAAEANLNGAVAQKTTLLLTITVKLGDIAAVPNLPTTIVELVTQALVKFLHDEAFPVPTLVAVAGSPGAPSSGGALSGLAGTPTAVDLSKQPLAASSQPGASSAVTASSMLGVSITRPFDPAKDTYNPKRVHKGPLPSTSDEARRARSQGATPATGAFGPPPPPRP